MTDKAGKPEDVSLNSLLPAEAQVLVSDNMIDLIERGELRPTLTIAQSMAREIKHARAAAHG